MKKIKLGLPIVLGSFALLLGSFFAFGARQNVTNTKAEPVSTATFTGFAGAWNPQLYGGPIARYILEFQEEFGVNDGTDFTNDIGDHFQLNGVSLKTLRASDSNVLIGHNNQGESKLFIRFNTSHVVATEEYPTPVFHIDGGTPFQNYLLPELTFAVDTSTFAMTQAQELTYNSYKNNEDWSSPHPSGVTYNGNAPSNGAMIGVIFNETYLNHPGNDVEDHTSTWGNNVFVNETRLSSIDGAIVGVYSASRLYIFVPSAYLTFVNPKSNTIHSTVYIKRAVYGNCIIPTMSFFWNGTIGSTGGWTKQTGPNNAVFNDIRWDGVDYGNYEGHQGIMLRYTSNLAQRGEYYNGGLSNINLINFGAFNVGSNIKLNGVALKDISGAEVCYHSEQNLWIYAPEMRTKGNVLDIEDVLVLDSYLPNQHLLFNTSWAAVEEDVFGNVSNFVKTYMHMDANVSGQCVGYYPTAKSAYGSFSDNAKMVFTNNATFSAAYARLVKWATYHGEVFNGNTFAAESNLTIASIRSDMENIAPILIIVVMSAVVLATSFVFMKKRKKD